MKKTTRTAAHRNQRGVSYFLFLIALVPILLLAMLVIDGGFLMTRKVHLESAMDTASLRASDALYNMMNDQSVADPNLTVREDILENGNEAPYLASAELTARALVRAQLTNEGFSEDEILAYDQSLTFTFTPQHVQQEQLVSFLVEVTSSYDQQVFFVPALVNQNSDTLTVSGNSTSLFCDYDLIEPNTVILVDTSCSMALFNEDQPIEVEIEVGPNLDPLIGTNAYFHTVAGLQKLIDEMEENKVIYVAGFNLGTQLITPTPIRISDTLEMEYTEVTQDPSGAFEYGEPEMHPTREVAKYLVANLRHNLNEWFAPNESFPRLCYTHTAGAIATSDMLMRDLRSWMTDEFGPAYVAQQSFALLVLSDGAPTNNAQAGSFNNMLWHGDLNIGRVPPANVINWVNEQFDGWRMGRWLMHDEYLATADSITRATYGLPSNIELLDPRPLHNAIHEANLPIIGNGFDQVDNFTSFWGAIDYEAGGCNYQEEFIHNSGPSQGERWWYGSREWGESYSLLAANFFRVNNPGVPILSVLIDQGFGSVFVERVSKIFRAMAKSTTDSNLLPDIPCNAVEIPQQKATDPQFQLVESIGQEEEHLMGTVGGFATVDVESAESAIALAITELFSQENSDLPPIRVDQRRSCIRPNDSRQNEILQPEAIDELGVESPTLSGG